MHSCRVQPISCSRSGIGHGRDDVARDDRESRVQLAQAHRPRVRRDHHAVGGDDAARRVQHRGRAAVELRDARALVDAHAQLERDAAQPAHEPRRLHDRRRRLEEAREVAVGAAAAHRLLGRPLLERHHAELAAGRHHAVPGAGLGLRRGRPEVAAAVVLRVDAVLARRTRRSRRRPPRRRARARARPRRRTAARACRAWPTRRSRSRRCGRSRRRRRCPARARRHRTTAPAA